MVCELHISKALLKKTFFKNEVPGQSKLGKVREGGAADELSPWASLCPVGWVLVWAHRAIPRARPWCCPYAHAAPPVSDPLH